MNLKNLSRVSWLVVDFDASEPGGEVTDVHLGNDDVEWDPFASKHLIDLLVDKLPDVPFDQAPETAPPDFSDDSVQPLKRLDLGVGQKRSLLIQRLATVCIFLVL